MVSDSPGPSQSDQTAQPDPGGPGHGGAADDETAGPMSAQAIGHRDALLARRAEAVDQLAALERTVASIVEATYDANSDDEHDPEGQTIAWDRAQTAALRDHTKADIADLDAALARLDTWDGRCRDCGQPIPVERLLARPAADRCVNCAQRNGSHRRPGRTGG